MGEGTNMYPNLNDQQQFILKKINEIKYYFVAEIREREFISKGFSKYIAAFDYFDKALIVLSATSGSISIGSFATVIGVLIGIARTSFSFGFSLTAGITKELLKTKQNKKKIHDKIVTLARCKLAHSFPIYPFSTEKRHRKN